ncbi:hypothetical protein [Pectinatus sottacetonis]|uniref:hypothetical protein n=1 Tax=Pectinatus sottacetonis TaxID=1002795 RepID=UPI0018C5D3F3|nr:hypothetical protein [Pectinatus sottacetonis]
MIFWASSDDRSFSGYKYAKYIFISFAAVLFAVISIFGLEINALIIGILSEDNIFYMQISFIKGVMSIIMLVILRWSVPKKLLKDEQKYMN